MGRFLKPSVNPAMRLDDCDAFMQCVSDEFTRRMENLRGDPKWREEVAGSARLMAEIRLARQWSAIASGRGDDLALGAHGTALKAAFYKLHAAVLDVVRTGRRAWQLWTDVGNGEGVDGEVAYRRAKWCVVAVDADLAAPKTLQKLCRCRFIEVAANEGIDLCDSPYQVFDLGVTIPGDFDTFDALLAGLDVCVTCGASTEGVARSICTGCRQVQYCSTACQYADWKRHKPACYKHRDAIVTYVDF